MWPRVPWPWVWFLFFRILNFSLEARDANNRLVHLPFVGFNVRLGAAAAAVSTQDAGTREE